MSADLTEVVAAAIYDRRGNLLMAQRASDASVESGLWEFPGGKVEAGESCAEAIVRELDEELGLKPSRVSLVPGARSVDLRRRIALNLWRVEIGDQRPKRRVHQRLCWVRPERCIALPLGQLDRQLARWACAPWTYHITPADAAQPIPPMAVGLHSSRSWILARWPGDTLYEGHLADLLLSSASRQRPIMLHDRLGETTRGETTCDGRVVGSHLSARTAAQFNERPIPSHRWLAISCHDQAEIEHANKLQADFALIGAVRRTASHPGQAGIGWQKLAALAAHATLPVLALGGVAPRDLDRARHHGCIGVAGISAFWRERQ